MFGVNNGGRSGEKGRRNDRRGPSGTIATSAQMIQVAPTTRPRPIHIPPRHPLNETPDESEPSFSYEEKNCYLAFDKEEEVVDAFHRRLAASSSSSGHHGGRTGRGGNFSASSFPNSINNNNKFGVSASPSVLTKSLSGTQDRRNETLRESSGGSNFWRTSSRKTSSSSTNKSLGKNAKATNDGSGNKSRNFSDNSRNNFKSRNSHGLVRGRRRLRSSGQTTKQRNDNDNNYDKKERNMGTYDNRVKPMDNNQSLNSIELFGASRDPTGEIASNINCQQQKTSSLPINQFHHSTSKFPHSNSASSSGGTGSINNNEARMKSKQRDEVRRMKLDAQQQISEDGGMVDNGYYHEVPTTGIELSNSNCNGTGNNIRGLMMSALEEEMSADNCTTDGSNQNATDNDCSNMFFHSNLETTTNNHINYVSINSTASNDYFGRHSMSSSKELVSAAGTAVAALSEHRHCNNKNISTISGENTISSLTYHINNIRQSSPSYQHQPQVVPIHLNDNTDNRSTASTMSDLSMADSNTNLRHQMSSSGSANFNSITSLNSLLNGKPVPIESPTLSARKNSPFQHQGTPQQQQQQFHRQHQTSLQQHYQRCDVVTGMPPPIATTKAGNVGTIGSRQSRDMNNGTINLMNVNAIKNFQTSNVTIPIDELQVVSANDVHNGAISKTGTLTTATSGSSIATGINNGSRLQTSEFNRYRNGENNTRRSSTESSQLANKIALLLDACETIRFPFKKKLILNSLHMTAADIPVKDLYGTVLGQSLHKLSLSGNRLSTIPRKLVTCLPCVKSIDISQCELHQLPERWNLPQLRRLNLSHNRLSDFPEETMLEGLPELQELNIFGNKVSAIVIPHNPKLLARLEILDLGYNDLAYLPDELDRLKSLRILKVMNNFLEKIPMRVCNMELKAIDVSNNPVIQPPIETCERGIGSMKRYYHCLSMEEQSKPNALEALQSKAARHSKKQAKSKLTGVGLNLHFSKPKRRVQVSTGRINSDESSQSSNSKSKSQNSLSSVSIQDRRSTVFDTKSSTIVSIDTDNRSQVAVTTQRSKSLQLPSITAFSSQQNVDKHDRSTSMPSIKNILNANTQSILSKADTAESGQVTINATLKVIFVGMAMAGKTSMIKRLIEGECAIIPKRDERTIGVDIYEWDPTIDKRYEYIDNRIQLQDKDLEVLCPNANVKFSVWDFAGQHVYHATHELFFSPRALYVIVWDMGAKNPATKQKARNTEDSMTNQLDAFKLGYDSDDASESDNDDFHCEEEVRRADRALERDIDEKVQFWVDCIQSSVPGAAILPVATFDDLFGEDDHYEAKRRCDILKKRLLKHEARRIQGVKDRLKEYVEQNRANDAPALRLRKLLGSHTRPKIIFGNDGDDSVVRVSGTEYTGFAKLTEKITNIATGRDTAKFRYPIFRGHVGARIPRMRLKVLDAVRSMRDRFKVVEWGYFFQQLEKDGITDIENVSDALHFLTNIGELSYFGDILPGRSQQNRMTRNEKSIVDSSSLSNELVSDDEDLDVDGNREGCRISSTSTIPTIKDGPVLTNGNRISGGLSQFVFLNPRWLVAAVACILRHDLDREIQETRRSLSLQRHSAISSNSFDEANMNCPVITSEDACMLWQSKKLTRKAAERAEENSAGIKLKPFEFLQLLLVRFRVFIPIDLGIERAFLGGQEYSHKSFDLPPSQAPALNELNHVSNQSDEQIFHPQSAYFFLPSLLGPGEPTEAWTYKSTDSWKATLCHSILFPDGVPPGLMERITATVLSNLYTMAHKRNLGASEIWGTTSPNGRKNPSYEGNISVKEILCWRNAFLVKLGMRVHSTCGEQKESIVEIFTALVDKDSNDCVGSDQMSVGSRRLVTSGKGQEGDGGRKIWMGGYLVVLEAVMEVMEEYGGLEFEKQGFCPECLAKKGVSEASCWATEMVQRAVKKGDTTIRCRHGHRVDIRLVYPYCYLDDIDKRRDNTKIGGDIQADPVVPISDMLQSVVVVALWDGKTRKIVRVGSGFIADKKRGLIVTASHTLMNIWSAPFGEDYYGMSQGKVVIGVISREKGIEEPGTEAIFRYFAKIVVKDPKIEEGICHLDACILRITTRMENDIGGNGEGCGDQIERLLLNNHHALKQEKLQQLKITDKCELDEPVRIIGYNQGGEGLMGPGISLNRYVDFARGYVCKKFAGGESNVYDQDKHRPGSSQLVRHRFKPREEIVVICPTIGGHSGGPCVNQQGEVIGILSRADPAENQRCYLVPTYEWRSLLRQAKKTL